jgi:hypothetical protein
MPICRECKAADAKTFCCIHKINLCSQCAEIHQGTACYFEAAIAIGKTREVQGKLQFP